MNIELEDFVPSFVLSRSYRFKLLGVATGAGFLLGSSIFRQEFPVIGAVLFTLGVVVEIGIVTTISTEMKQIEEDTNQALRNIEQTQKEINGTKREVEIIQGEVEHVQTEIDESVFSFTSDSQGIGIGSLEDRLNEVERAVGTGKAPSSHDSIPRRLSELESEVKQIKRGGDRRF